MPLDSTYFQGELHLPNLKYSGPAVGMAAAILTVSENTLDWFIAKYEPEFLDRLLGKELAGNFAAHITDDPVDGVWTALAGMIYRNVGGYKYSPAANYVYYWTKRNSRTQTTMSGEKVAEQDYGTTAADADKLVKAWNDMCRMVSEIRRFIFDNWNDYKAYASCRGAVCVYPFVPTNSFGI